MHWKPVMSRYAQNAVTHLTQIIKLEFDNIMWQSRYAQNTVTTSHHIQPEHNSMPMQHSNGKKLTCVKDMCWHSVADIQKQKLNPDSERAATRLRNPDPYPETPASQNLRRGFFGAMFKLGGSAPIMVVECHWKLNSPKHSYLHCPESKRAHFCDWDLHAGKFTWLWVGRVTVCKSRSHWALLDACVLDSTYTIDKQNDTKTNSLKNFPHFYIYICVTCASQPMHPDIYIYIYIYIPHQNSHGQLDPNLYISSPCRSQVIHPNVLEQACNDRMKLNWNCLIKFVPLIRALQVAHHDPAASPWPPNHHI